MDEPGRIRLRKRGRHSGEKSLHLHFAMATEPGCNAVEVGIVIAGVTDKFEGSSSRHGVQDLGERCCIKIAGGRDSQGAVSGENRSFTKCRVTLKCRSELIQKMDLHAAF